MKLWEKNYLITFILFLIVLNSSVFLLLALVFQNDFEREIKTAVREEESISYTVTRLYDLPNMQGKLDAFCKQYERNGIYLKLSDSHTELADTLPITMAGTNLSSTTVSIPTSAVSLSADSIDVSIHEAGGKKYLLIMGNDVSEQEILYIVYMRDLQSIYIAQRNRIISYALICLLLSVFVGTMLYIAMKKINKPIDNIAHELRTPLTSIRGYAQYILAGNLTEEDRYFAVHQIVEESQNLKEIVDKLLAMGRLGGEAAYDKIQMNEIFTEMRKLYPNIEIINEMRVVLGDKTLIKSLLGNLISNAERAGGQVKITAKENRIEIQNSGSVIDVGKLKSLNRNLSLSKEQIDGTGFGVGLCHDIVRMHKGKLTFQSSAETGTTVTVHLPESRV